MDSRAGSEHLERMHALLLAFALGCSQPPPVDAVEGCEPTLTATTAGDATLGFSADDVLAMLAGALPTEVVWDEMTQGDAATDVTLALAAAGDPALAEPGGDTSTCPETGTWLRIPVGLQITLAGGEVTASGTIDLDAGALDAARVHLTPDWDLPATLSGDYATQFDAFFADEYASRGFELDGTWIALARTWTEPVVDIELQATSPDAGLAAVAWRGTWTVP